MFSFFQDDFAKPEFGHYFCPFFSFPKKSWKKKYTNLYNKWIYLLKETIKARVKIQLLPVQPYKGCTVQTYYWKTT